MAIHSADLNQNALSKLQAQEQFPQVQEQKVEKVKIAKDTIQGQVSLALEMMKAWETPVIDVSKLPKLASNWVVTKEQLELSQVSADTFQDISKLSPKAQDEFIAIYKEFKKNNPWVMLGKSNPYWGNIFKAVDIKSKQTGDITELQAWQEAINHAVASHWINHWLRWAEAKVYRYFKSKIELLEKVSNPELKQLILKWENEFLSNWWNSDKFYYFVNRLTGNKIRVFITKRLKKYSPNFYQELSNLLLENESNLIFSKEFYSIIKWEERLKKWEERLKKWEERLKKWEERLKEWEERLKKWEELLDFLEKNS